MAIIWSKSSNHLRGDALITLSVVYIFQIITAIFTWHFGTTSRAYPDQNGVLLTVIASSALAVLILYGLMQNLTLHSGSKWTNTFHSFLYILLLSEGPVFLVVAASAVLTDTPVVGCYTQPLNQNSNGNFTQSGAAAGLLLTALCAPVIILLSWIKEASHYVAKPDKESVNLVKMYSEKYSNVAAYITLVVKVIFGRWITINLGEPNCYWLALDGFNSTKPVYTTGCIDNVDSMQTGHVDREFRICMDHLVAKPPCTQGLTVVGSELIELRHSLIGQNLSVYQCAVIVSLVLTAITVILGTWRVVNRVVFTVQYDLTPDDREELQLLEPLSAVAEHIIEHVASVPRYQTSTRNTMHVRGMSTTKLKAGLHHTAFNSTQQSVATKLEEIVKVTQIRERQFVRLSNVMVLQLCIRIFSVLLITFIYGVVVQISWDAILHPHCLSLATTLHDLRVPAMGLFAAEAADWLLLFVPFIHGHFLQYNVHEL